MVELKNKTMDDFEDLRQRMYNLSKKFDEIICLLNLEKKTLQLDDVCKLTGLSRSSVYKLTCKNEIPHYKKAKHLYFDKEEIENWIRS